VSSASHAEGILYATCAAMLLVVVLMFWFVMSDKPRRKK